MIRLTVTIDAEHPDELADAYSFLLERGIALNPANSDADAVGPTPGNVINLPTRVG